MESEQTFEMEIEPLSDEHGKNDLQLVSFHLDEEEFGVDILSVQEIIRMMEITVVPNMPHYVQGVLNLRGKVLPVINLRARLGLPQKPYGKGTRIIVVEFENKNIGFVVDAVSEVLRMPQQSIEAPPAMVGKIESEYITAVGKLQHRLIILLDLSRVLTLQASLPA